MNNPLKRHRVMSRFSDFIVAYCGHTRTHVEAARIKAELPELWATAPRCSACDEMKALSLDLEKLQAVEQ